MKITFSRWPWQLRNPHFASKSQPGDKYGWFNLDGMGRFGGGWNFKLGIMIGGSTIIIDLIFGSIRISLKRKENQ